MKLYLKAFSLLFGAVLIVTPQISQAGFVVDAVASVVTAVVSVATTVVNVVVNTSIAVGSGIIGAAADAVGATLDVVGIHTGLTDLGNSLINDSGCRLSQATKAPVSLGNDNATYVPGVGGGDQAVGSCGGSNSQNNGNGNGQGIFGGNNGGGNRGPGHPGQGNNGNGQGNGNGGFGGFGNGGNGGIPLDAIVLNAVCSATQLGSATIYANKQVSWTIVPDAIRGGASFLDQAFDTLQVNWEGNDVANIMTEGKDATTFNKIYTTIGQKGITATVLAKLGPKTYTATCSATTTVKLDPGTVHEI